MIRRLVAITLLLALLSSILSKLFVYAEFKSNQAYIAANLCENRDRPELNCEGKCYLMKKLKAAEDKEKKQEKASEKKAGFEMFFATELSLATPVAEVPAQKPSVAIFFTLPQFSTEISHPPAYAC